MALLRAHRDRTALPDETGAGGASLAALRGRLAALEGAWHPSADGAEGALSFGIGAIDEALPWGGLRRDGLHEIAALGSSGAAAGFAAWLAARLGGAVLWCLTGHGAGEHGSLYGPGLAAFGLTPARLVVARARQAREVLWAMEEGLRSGAVAAVIGELESLGLTESRRLQLAAEASGTTALALRPRGQALEPNAALSRWRLAAVPPPPGQSGLAPVLGSARWHLALWRCRGGAGADWIVEWCDETGDLRLAADPADRPLAAAAGEDCRTAGQRAG